MPEVIISSSAGLKDLHSSSIKSFPKKDIIDLNSGEKMPCLPTTDYEEVVLEIFKNRTGNSSKYNIKIFTGPVVTFRSWDYTRKFLRIASAIAPLFRLHDIKQVSLEWPIIKSSKGQYINIEEG